MANQFVNFTPYDEQMAELQRRQRMADLLQQQAVTPLETPQSGGRMIAKVSPIAGLAKLLQGYMAGKESRDIEKQRGAAEEAARTQAMDWVKGFQPSVGVSPDAALQASMTPTDQQTNVQPQVTSLTPQERQNRLYQGAMSGNPYTSKMAQMLMSQKQPTAPIKEIEAEKFTPESLAAFQQSALTGTPNYGVLKAVAAKAESTPSAIQEYNFAKNQGYQGTFQDWELSKRRAGATNVTTTYGAPVAGVDAQGNPVFFQPSKEGGKPAIIPGVAPEKKQPTAEQAGAAGFAGRLEAADKIISESPFVPTVANQAKSMLPFSSKFIDAEQQKFEQAKRNFITAQLRKESGASISPSEFSVAEKMYFPQPGDSPQVIAQKAQTRQQAIAAMRGASGNVMPNIPDMPPPGAVRLVKP